MIYRIVISSLLALAAFAANTQGVTQTHVDGLSCSVDG